MEWQDGRRNEFLANKKSEALSSCITSGVLCAGDYSPVASQAAEKRKAHAMELKAEREREAKKRRDFMSFRPIALSAGDKVFFATTVPISVRNQVLARRRVHLERCMTNASWFVVDRIGDLAQCKVGWAASLWEVSWWTQNTCWELRLQTDRDRGECALHSTVR